MNLQVGFHSAIDNNLLDEYNRIPGRDRWPSDDEWREFLMTFPGVERVSLSPSGTDITFDGPEHRTWFLMRWS